MKWIICKPTSSVSRPSETAVSNKGNIVSNPGKPGGGFELFFSSTVCGAVIYSENRHSQSNHIKHKQNGTRIYRHKLALSIKGIGYTR